MERTGPREYLGGLSTLAGRSFSSAQESTEAILRLIADQLGMRSAFLTHITIDEERNEIIASYNAPGGCDILPGLVLPLSGTF